MNLYPIEIASKQPIIASTILDRILHHAHIISINRKSYQ